jgi:membrane associated rhomboid family serine protease
MFSLPRVTQGLILANVLVFVLDSALGGGLSGWLALWPLGDGFMPWQMLTYAFVHASVQHILFNMFGLYMFGADVERVWGERRFLAYYLACALAAAITQLVIASFGVAAGPTVGASGAIFGVLLAYARLFPHRMIMPLSRRSRCARRCSSRCTACSNWCSASAAPRPAWRTSRTWAGCWAASCCCGSGAAGADRAHSLRARSSTSTGRHSPPMAHWSYGAGRMASRCLHRIDQLHRIG